MVGVTADASQANQLSSVRNPMIKYMLKTRENHAREQDRDYSHVFRRKTRFEMFRLSAIAMAIEFALRGGDEFRLSDSPTDRCGSQTHVHDLGTVATDWILYVPAAGKY